jgi:hypothetical protein
MNSIEFQKQLSSGFFVLTEQTAGADTSCFGLENGQGHDA